MTDFAIGRNGLWLPDARIEVPHIELPPKVFDHDGVMSSMEAALRDGILGSTERVWRKAADKWMTWMASFGGAYAAKILDHVFNDGTLSAPAPYLALGTGAINDSDVGASFGGTTEANYTGYLRVLIGAADMSAASSGAPATKTNSAVLTFPACSGSSSTVIAWCTVAGSSTARLNAGDIILYGTCTSTVIDTTHTPPSIAASGLNATLE